LIRHDKLPLDRPLLLSVLVVILRWKRIAGHGGNFVTASVTSVNAGMWRFCAWIVKLIKGIGNGYHEISAVIEIRHLVLPLNSCCQMPKKVA